MFPLSPSVATQRQQSRSTPYDYTTLKRNETSRVSSLPALEDGGALERTSTLFFTKPDKATFQAKAGIKSEIDAV